MILLIRNFFTAAGGCAVAWGVDLYTHDWRYTGAAIVAMGAGLAVRAAIMKVEVP